MVMEFLVWKIGQNSGQDVLISIGVVVLVFLGFKLIAAGVIAHLKRFAKKTKTDLDDLVVDMIAALGWPCYVLVALYFGAKSLTLPPIVDTILNWAIIIIATFYVVRSLQSVVKYIAQKHISKKASDNKDHDVAVVNLVSMLVSVVLYIFAIIFILSNFGVDISSLIAGLGIGGLAVALALQNILSDLFSSFSIYFDKPFEVGDFIVIGDDKGVVKKIGIKSTRIKTLQGEELVVSNQELTKTRVQNFKKMKKRRIAFSVGVTYSTVHDKLKQIPQLIKTIVEKQEHANFDRAHFHSFNDSSLGFDVVYYMNVSDYAEFMNTQQSINLGIVKAFEKEMIEIAFPTRTIYMKKE